MVGPSMGLVCQRNRHIHHWLCLPGFLHRIQCFHRDWSDPSTDYFRLSGRSAVTAKKVSTISAKVSQVQSARGDGLGSQRRHGRLYNNCHHFLVLTYRISGRAFEYE